MYEPTTVEVDRAHGEGTYRSHSLYFVGRLIRMVEAGHTTMRLYEWANRGRLLYLVHVEEDKPGRPPRRTLYPFINTHSAGTTPPRDTRLRTSLGLTPNSPTGGSDSCCTSQGPGRRGPPSSCLIHPRSAWKVRSANFGCRGCSEVRLLTGASENRLLGDVDYTAAEAPIDAR